MTDAIAQQLAIRYARIMDDRSFDQLEEIMVEDIVMAIQIRSRTGSNRVSCELAAILILALIATNATALTM